MTNSVRSLSEGLDLLKSSAEVLGESLLVNKEVLKQRVNKVLDAEDQAVEARNKANGTNLNKLVGQRKILLARVDALPGGKKAKEETGG